MGKKCSNRQNVALCYPPSSSMLLMLICTTEPTINFFYRPINCNYKLLLQVKCVMMICSKVCRGFQFINWQFSN